MKEEKTKIILLPILLKSNVVYFIFRKGTKCQLDLDYLAIKKNSKKIVNQIKHNPYSLNIKYNYFWVFCRLFRSNMFLCANTIIHKKMRPESKISILCSERWCTSIGRNAVMCLFSNDLKLGIGVTFAEVSYSKSWIFLLSTDTKY